MRHLWRVKNFNKQQLPIIYVKMTNVHIYVTIVDKHGNTIGQISTYDHTNNNNSKCYNIEQTKQFAIKVVDYFKQKQFTWSKKVLYTYGKHYIGKLKVLCDQIYQITGGNNV